MKPTSPAAHVTGRPVVRSRAFPYITIRLSLLFFSWASRTTRTLRTGCLGLAGGMPGLHAVAQHAHCGFGPLPIDRGPQILFEFAARGGKGFGALRLD